MRSLSLLLCVVVGGCDTLAELGNHPDDAGSGSDAGAGVSDGGAVVGSGDPVFGEVAVADQGLSEGPVIGLQARGSELYALTERAFLFRSTGAAFQPVIQVITNNSAVGLYAGSSALLVAGRQSLSICRSASCESPASWEQQPLAEPGVVIRSMCGVSQTEVYLVATVISTSAVSLYQWNGAALTRLSGNLGATSLSGNQVPESPAGCWITPDRHLYIAAYLTVVNYDLDTATAVTEDLPGARNEVRSVIARDGVPFAGCTYQEVWMRSASGWALSFSGGDLGLIDALGIRPGTHHVYAAVGGSSISDARLVRFDGQSWSGVDVPANEGISSMLWTSSNEVYLGTQHSHVPGVVRGRW